MNDIHLVKLASPLLHTGLATPDSLLYPVRGTERDFARFYVLETVARVPYFAYLSVLHLRETFGDREGGEKMRTHYAEGTYCSSHCSVFIVVAKSYSRC